MIKRWFVQQRWGLMLGLGLTLAAVVLHGTGFTQRFELLWLDFHIRHFSRIDKSDRIVHIDITDDALDRVGSWPWPRDIQAELIRIINDLGAEQIIVDIVFSEPKSPLVRIPELDTYADIEGEIEQIGELSPENVVLQDDELARAIGDAGNVYLGMYYQHLDQPTASAISPKAKQILELLRKDFELNVAAIAQKVDETKEAVEAILAGLKRRAARELVGNYLKSNPQATVQQVHQAILSTPFDKQTADRADILAAYLYQLGLQEFRTKGSPVPPKLKDKLHKVDQIEPLVYKFTHDAKRVGFVNFNTDIDGRTRHLPLLCEWNGMVIEQLGLAAVRDLLNIKIEDLTIDNARNLLIPASPDRKAIRVQLDDRGQTLINWHIVSRHWYDCFFHLPATKLLQIYDCRKQIKDNQTRKQLRIAQAMRLYKGEEGFELYRSQVNEMLKKERQIRLAKLKGRVDNDKIKAVKARVKQLRQLIEQDQNDTIKFIIEDWTNLKNESNPNDPDIADDYKRFQQAHSLITDRTAELEQANKNILIEQKRLTAQLKPLIENKICFVGYTASAVADMITTPAYERMPGVMVHSNLLNSFLQRQFRSWTDKPTQLVIIAIFGVLMTLLTTTHGPRAGLVLVMVVFLAGFCLNAFAVFRFMDHWLQLFTALVLTFVVWAIIVLLRYLTTDRQRRWFSKAVAQYVSQAMANQIANSGVKLDLAPVKGQVTCFFSDLKGFTRISERLGPEGTKTILNPYLETMSEILHKHQALINKFMGDGIFA
ncbi:MAG: CHASE2 domain-containing protein, partial [Planctomycetota bacterium]